MARRLAAVLVAALALAGCGGSSKDSESTTTTTQSTAATQAAYANTVAATFQGGNLSKEKLKQSATTVSDANKRLADDLDTLGTPPKIGGPKAKAAVNKLSNELNSSADQIEKAAKGISTAQDSKS